MRAFDTATGLHVPTQALDLATAQQQQQDQLGAILRNQQPPTTDTNRPAAPTTNNTTSKTESSTAAPAPHSSASSGRTDTSTTTAPAPATNTPTAARPQPTVSASRSTASDLVQDETWFAKPPGSRRDPAMVTAVDPDNPIGPSARVPYRPPAAPDDPDPKGHNETPTPASRPTASGEPTARGPQSTPRVPSETTAHESPQVNEGVHADSTDAPQRPATSDSPDAPTDDLIALLSSAQQGNHKAARTLNRRLRRTTTQRVSALLGWDPAYSTPPKPIRRLASAISVTALRSVERGRWAVPRGQDIGDWVFATARNTLLDNLAQLTAARRRLVSEATGSGRHRVDLTERRAAEIDRLTRQVHARARTEEPPSPDPFPTSESQDEPRVPDPDPRARAAPVVQTNTAAEINTTANDSTAQPRRRHKIREPTGTEHRGEAPAAPESGTGRNLPIPSPADYDSINEWLKAVRLRREISPSKCGELIGVSTKRVREIERTHHKPLLTYLRQFRDALNIPNAVLVAALKRFYSRSDIKVRNRAEEALFWKLIASRPGSAAEKKIRKQIFENYEWMPEIATKGWFIHGQERDDLVDQVVVKIMTAIQNFVPPGCFGPVAWSHARFALSRAYYANRYPGTNQEELNKIIRISSYVRRAEQAGQPVPDNDEEATAQIAAALDMAEATVAEIRYLMDIRTVAFQDAVQTKSRTSKNSSGSSKITKKGIKAGLRAALSDFPEPDIAARIVELHFIQGYPAAEVCKQVPITPEAVEELIAQLREALRRTLPRPDTREMDSAASSSAASWSTDRGAEPDRHPTQATGRRLAAPLQELTIEELTATAGRTGWFRAVTDAVREAIRSGSVSPGTLLPSAREFAQQLGLSEEAQIGRAYRKLAAEGYVVTKRGVGTTVTSWDQWPDSPVAQADRPVTAPELLEIFAAASSQAAFATKGASRGWRDTVVSALREAIRSGALSEGRLLPPAQELARELGLSSGTSISKAYRQLADEGYVIIRHGTGTVVADQARWKVRGNESDTAADNTAQVPPPPRNGSSDLSRVASGTTSGSATASWLPAAHSLPESPVPHPDAEAEKYVKQAIAADLFLTYGIELVGLDKPTISIATALSIRNAIVDELAENDAVRIDAIIVLPLENETYASAGMLWGGPEHLLLLNETYFGNPESFRAGFKRNVEAGWLNAPTEDPAYDVVRHEIAHLRDPYHYVPNENNPRYQDLAGRREAGTLPSDARFDKRRDYRGWLEAKAFGFLYTHFVGLKEADALPKETRFDEWLDLLDGYSRELKQLFSGEAHEKSPNPGVAEPTLGDRPVFNPREALAEANNAFGKSAPADFTHPVYALQALLRGVPVAQVWRDAEQRNAVAAARAHDRGPAPEAAGFRASMLPDGVLVRLTRRWRELSPDEQQETKSTDSVLMSVGRDGRQTYGLDELARSVDRQRAEMWGADTHSHESDTADPLLGFAEWEHAPSGVLGQWLHNVSEMAWQRADLLREVRQVLGETDGLAEFLGLGAWAEAGAAQAYLDVVDLRARVQAALSHPDTDDRMQSQLRALLSHIDAIMRRCTGFDGELAFARTRAEQQAVQHVAAARGGLSLGPYGRIVDGNRVEVFEGRQRPSAATEVLRDMLRQLGIPVITRQVRVDPTGRVLVEDLPEPVRASTARRQDRLWQLCSPITDTQPLRAADEPDEHAATSPESAWQHSASTVELPQPAWGARIDDTQRKLARTTLVRQRLFPVPVDPDRMTPADQARQRTLLARLEMLTEYLRTVRLQAAAAATQQCLDQLPGQRLGRWARLDGNLLTIASPFADPEHFLPQRTREALAQAGIRVEYRWVRVDAQGRAWSITYSPTGHEPQSTATADQAARALVDNIIGHLDRLLERHGVTEASGDRIPLPQLLADRDNLVAEREQARAARDRWREERERMTTARNGDDTASAAHEVAVSNAAQIEREFRRLDTEIARLTLLAFGTAEAEPEQHEYRESARRMLRSDAKTQSLVGATRTPDLLQEIRDPLVAHLLSVAQRLRADLDQLVPTESFDTTVALTEMLEDINDHQTELSNDAADTAHPTGAGHAGATMHSAHARAAAKPRQVPEPTARQANPAEGRPAAAPDAANRPLSKRQREIFTLIAEGKTNAEIAEHLQMPVEAVETHVRRIRDELGVARRSELEPPTSTNAPTDGSRGAPQRAAIAAAGEANIDEQRAPAPIRPKARASSARQLDEPDRTVHRDPEQRADQPASTPWQKSAAPALPDLAGTGHALDRVRSRPGEISEAPRGSQSDELGMLNDPDTPWSALKRNAGKRFRHASDTPTADTSIEANPTAEVEPEIPDRAQALLDRLGCGPTQVEQLAASAIAQLRNFLGPDAGLSSLTMAVDPDDLVQASAVRANAVARWWNALTHLQQAALILRHPHQIGNADGVPYTVRDEANRRSIIDDIKRFLKNKPDADNKGLLTEARALLGLGRPGHALSREETVRLTNLVRTLQHLADLEQDVREFGSPPVQLIAFDATAYDGDGRIIVSIDDADKAAIVTRQLGGVGNTLQKLPKRARAVVAQYAESARHNPGVPTATIIDIGFHHPNTVEEIRSAELAEQGGYVVAAEIAAYDATRATWAGLPGGAARPRLRTVVAHSYGATTLCYAGRSGRLAAHVDQVVLTGCPGAGPMAHADEFGIGADNVFAVADDRDPVSKAGSSAPELTDRYFGFSHGSDPVGPWGAVRLAAAMPSTVRSVKRIHGGYLVYLDPEQRVPTTSLHNIALVCAGRADLAERAQHRSLADPTGRLRDLFWWRANAAALATAMGADEPEAAVEPNILPDNGTRPTTGPAIDGTASSPWQRSEVDAEGGLELDRAPRRSGAAPDVVEALDLPIGKRPDQIGIDRDPLAVLPRRQRMEMVFAGDPNLDGDAHAIGPSSEQPNLPAEEPVSLRELLSTNRPYRQLYVSNALAGMGDNLQRSALPLLTLDLTGSAMTAGLISFALWIPQVLFELPAGYVADFHDRWRTMFIAQSVGLTSAAAAGALVLSGAPDPGTALAAATLVEGTAAVFYLRSLRSVVLDLVTPAQRSRANRLSEIEVSIATTGGRALGPILLDMAKSLPFAANGLSYAWNLGTLSRLRDAFPRRTSADPHAFRDSLRHIGEGVRAVWQEPFLREYSGLTLLTNASFAALNLRTAAVLDDAALPGAAAGAVFAAAGAGGVVGGLLPVRFIEKVRADVVYPVSLAGFTGVAALQAVSTNPIAIAAGAFGVAALGVSMNARIASYEQSVLPRSIYGRATSAKSLVLGAGPAVGGLLGGALLSSQGITPAGWIPVAVIGAAAAGAAVRRLVKRGRGLIELPWRRTELPNEGAAAPIPEPVTDAQRALPDHADSFTQSQAGSDRDFAAAAHAYLSDLITVARYHLTQADDRNTGLDLLSRITEVLSVVDTRLALGQAPGTAHREIRQLHGELTSLLDDTTQDRGDEITNVASRQLAPATPDTNALARTLTRLRRVGHPLGNCITRTSRAAWALGVDAGIQPAQGENDWEALENAINAQLMPVHPPTDATAADTLASIVEDVRNRRNGTDSAVFLVDDGTKMHSWLVTAIDGEVIVFDTNVGDPDPDEPSTPRIRTHDQWTQSYPHIEEAFVAYLKSGDNKLAARDEPVPDAARSFPRRGPITGPPAADAASNEVPPTRTADEQQESARSGTAHTEPEPPDNPKTFTAEELETIAELKRQLLEIDPKAFWYIRDLPMPKPGEPFGDEWVSNRGEWFDALFWGKVEKLREVELTEKDFLELGRILQRFPIYVTLTLLVATGLKVEQLLHLPRTTPGSLFFKQVKRVQGDKTTTVYKFRTMREDEPEKPSNRDTADRISRGQQFARDTSLDELPQLLAIARGRMQYYSGRPMLDGDRERMRRVLTPDEYVIWDAHLKNDLWSALHFPGCRALDPDSDEYLRSRYLAARLWSMIGSRRAEEYMMKVVDRYLLGLLPGKLRELMWGTGTDVLAGVGHILGSIGNWTRRAALSVFPDTDTQTAVGGPPDDHRNDVPALGAMPPGADTIAAALGISPRRAYEIWVDQATAPVHSGPNPTVIT
ncbi:MFS transporter [Nocardia vinacea]|uniref:MFS transporter n=1 Tax=Nocardia vinacea TaxID=96468 RepID=UPI00343D08FB